MAYDMWEDESTVASHGVDVPAWINKGISVSTVAAVMQGGCASGSYMPAVTYHQALDTMSTHGDDVLQYIQDRYGELPKPEDNISWAGIAVFYLSIAVEAWAFGAEAWGFQKSA